jgi:hypothetical protein
MSRWAPPLTQATGARNIALGRGAGSLLGAGSDNIYIGNVGVGGDSKAIRIGDPKAQTAAYLAGVNGTTLAGPFQYVVIDAAGQLGVAGAPGTPAAPDTSALQATVQSQQKQIDTLIAGLKAQEQQLAEQKKQLQKLSKKGKKGKKKK